MEYPNSGIRNIFGFRVAASGPGGGELGDNDRIAVTSGCLVVELTLQSVYFHVVRRSRINKVDDVHVGMIERQTFRFLIEMALCARVLENNAFFPRYHANRGMRLRRVTNNH